MTTPEKTIAEMKTRAENYAAAFNLASHACRVRPNASAQELAEYFKGREKLELDLLETLQGPNAIQFLRDEGILWPS